MRYPTRRDGWAYALFGLGLAASVGVGLLLAQLEPMLGAVVALALGVRL